jgi:hypothetical protein
MTPPREFHSFADEFRESAQSERRTPDLPMWERLPSRGLPQHARGVSQSNAFHRREDAAYSRSRLANQASAEAFGDAEAGSLLTSVASARRTLARYGFFQRKTRRRTTNRRGLPRKAWWETFASGAAPRHPNECSGYHRKRFHYKLFDVPEPAFSVRYATELGKGGAR